MCKLRRAQGQPGCKQAWQKSQALVQAHAQAQCKLQILAPTMPPSSESSPNRRARSHSDCVADSTGIGSLYVNRCCCERGMPAFQVASQAQTCHLFFQLPCTPLHQAPRSESPRSLAWVSALAWSINILASAVNPLIAQPMCSSISMIFSMLLGSCGPGRWTRASVQGTAMLQAHHLMPCTAPTSRGEVMRFSTASTTPSEVVTPMAVEPSCRTGSP